jgi:tRNA-specific 2-thiouridylase
MKALALFSGGLDSIIAVRIVQEAGVTVEAVHFLLPVLSDFHRLQEHSSKVMESARQLQIKLHLIKLGEDYLRIIENPAFGYGKNMNPCIDCRIFLLKEAAKLMNQIGASFLITGEVLGQRPKSQHEAAFNIAERESGLKGLILRPLSAHRLPPTIPEEKGWINREKLLGIAGRGRNTQIELAAHWGLKYPAPAGGCLLTMKEYSSRLRELLKTQSCLDLENVLLLRFGRHFRLSNDCKAVVGRDQQENLALMWFYRAHPEGRTLLKIREKKGPLTLLTGPADQDLLRKAAAITAWYAHVPEGTGVSAKGLTNGRKHLLISDVMALDQEEMERLRVK